MALTLAVGVGLGYVRWGREARELREALVRALALFKRGLHDVGLADSRRNPVEPRRTPSRLRWFRAE